MLRTTLLIAKREYLERVRSRVFRITTILIPVAIGGLAMLGGVGGRRMEGVTSLAIASNNPVLAQEIRAALEKDELPPKTIEVFAPVTDGDQAELNQEVTDHRIGGYLLVQDSGQGEPDATWISGSSTDFVGKAQMEEALNGGLVRERLREQGMSEAQVQALMERTTLKTMQLKGDAVVASNASRSFAGAYALILVLYGSVLFYGINMARSVVEEKTSRVFEVLLSTTSSDSLMMGKLLGVGAAALTQMAIWGLLLVLFAGSALAANVGIHGLGSLGITKAELLFFGIFFLLGFYLYSGLAAALGSTVSAEQEVQQFSIILISPLVVAVVLLPYVLGNPSAPGAVILSLIPPFTPIIMYMRICSAMPPMWQIALSIVLLAASVWGIVWLAARIYRVGVLMYGKRATIPEILRWLRYS